MLPTQPPAAVETPAAALTPEEARAVLEEAARQQDSMEKFMRLAVVDDEES